jgi:uncharacterized protein YbjT (DUF2867 family)
MANIRQPLSRKLSQLIMSSKIVVLGATGHIGSVLAHKLVKAGHQVTAVGRSADKLADLKAAGAHIAVGDIQDSVFLKNTFAGADRAFVMIPPNNIAPDYPDYQHFVTESIYHALKGSSITHIVNLSSEGAQFSHLRVGPVRGASLQEVRLNALSDKHIVHLEPSYFFENSLAFIPQIQNGQTVYNSNVVDMPFPAIATSDIAEVAFHLLDKANFERKSIQPLHGSKDITFGEIVETLGKALGVDKVNYVQIPPEAFEDALLKYGMGASMAALYKEMSVGMNEDGIFSKTKRDASSTTKTTYAEWVATALKG